MNKSKILKLNESHVLPVKISNCNGDTYYSNINLKYGYPPNIILRENNDKIELNIESAENRLTTNYFLSAVEKNNFLSPTIFKYLYYGKANKDNLTEVKFTIPELSSYFNKEITYNLDNEANITGNLKIKSLEANLNNLGLYITIEQGIIFKNNEDHSGFSFKNLIYFCYKSEQVLSFQEIEKLMYKAAGLLTWVLGYPVAADTITVSDGKKIGYLYLPLVKKQKVHDISNSKSFMGTTYFRRNFESICNKYFSQNEIFEIWSRTLPLFDFSGVLEYEVMLHASILDRYFSHQINKLELIKTVNYDNDIDKINTLLKENKELNEILKNTNLIDKIDAKNLFSEIQPITFIKKQKAYFNYIGDDYIKIFIGKNDFFQIKSIRDKAAHGDKSDFCTEEILKYIWKVKLLTMFLIYRDLGINEDDFVKIITNSLHPFIINCEKDKVLLDLKSGKSICISVSNIELKKMKELNTDINVFMKLNENYLFNTELSSDAHKYFLNLSPEEYQELIYHSYEKYVLHLLEMKNCNMKVKSYSEIYIKNKNKEIISNVIVVEPI